MAPQHKIFVKSNCGKKITPFIYQKSISSLKQYCPKISPQLNLHYNVSRGFINKMRVTFGLPMTLGIPHDLSTTL